MRLPEPQSTAWLDGRRARVAEIGIPLTDPAVHVGLGAFETLAVRDGRALEVESHLERLAESAARLAIELPPPAVLRPVVLAASAEEPARCGWLKILVTRGGRWIVVTGAMDPAEEGRAVSAVLLPWRRAPEDPLTGVKTTSYAHNEIGLEHARRRGADEGLWRNTRGMLTEGCSSNLFAIRGRRVFTPAEREGLLGGVIRALTIRAVREAGLTLHEGRVRPRRLLFADEAFLTSSLCGVRPLVACDGRPIGRGKPGPVTRQITEAVMRLRHAGAGPAS